MIIEGVVDWRIDSDIGIFHAYSIAQIFFLTIKECGVVAEKKRFNAKAQCRGDPLGCPKAQRRKLNIQRKGGVGAGFIPPVFTVWARRAACMPPLQKATVASHLRQRGGARYGVLARVLHPSPLTCEA